MRETDRIVDQMMQAHVGEPWTGPSLTGLLDGVTFENAAAKPIAGAHSIWEIVLHLMTTQTYIMDLVRGVGRPFQPGEEWPPIGKTNASAWKETVERFRQGEERVRHTVAEQFADDRLDEPLQNGGSSAYNNLHGYVQHAFYHGGQISMLRKLID